MRAHLVDGFVTWPRNEDITARKKSELILGISRLDYQALYGKGMRAPHPKSLLGHKRAAEIEPIKELDTPYKDQVKLDIVNLSKRSI